MNIRQSVKNVLITVLIANLFVAAMKIVIGMVSGSASIFADGLHSISDGTGNIIGLIGIWIASKPVDESHPYGHKKFETIASLFICTSLTIIATRVVLTAVEKIQHPTHPDISIITFAIMITTLIINIFVTTIEKRKGIELKSDILVSDAEHTKSDVYITTGVIITMILLELGAPPIIDGLISIIISLFIYKAAYDVFMSATSVLSDAAVLDKEEVKKAVLELDQIENCHKIRSRGRQDDIFLDLHVMIDPKMSVEDAHSLDHKIEAHIKTKFGNNVHVIIHIEPFFTEDDDDGSDKNI